MISWNKNAAKLHNSCVVPFIILSMFHSTRFKIITYITSIIIWDLGIIGNEKQILRYWKLYKNQAYITWLVVVWSIEKGITQFMIWPTIRNMHKSKF